MTPLAFTDAEREAIEKGIAWFRDDPARWVRGGGWSDGRCCVMNAVINVVEGEQGRVIDRMDQEKFDAIIRANDSADSLPSAIAAVRALMGAR